MSETPSLIEAVAKAILDARYKRDNDRLNLNLTWDKLDAGALDVYRDQARAALLAIEQSGTHVVVPVESTVEMDVEATEQWLCIAAMEDRSAAIWKTMLSARPKMVKP